MECFHYHTTATSEMSTRRLGLLNFQAFSDELKEEGCINGDSDSEALERTSHAPVVTALGFVGLRLVCLVVELVRARCSVPNLRDRNR